MISVAQSLAGGPDEILDDSGSCGFARSKAAARRAIALVVLGLVAFSAPRVRASAARPEVIRVYPHDPGAFTQGLLFYGGKLYESTGLRGRSSLRRVALATGVVEAKLELANDLFGEGLALAGDRLIQLTWQNHVALVYDLAFERVGSFDYEGEGWGLCDDGRRLIMSDGSSHLFFRDRDSFALISDVDVSHHGRPVPRLNELECVGSLVYANVWQTNVIVRIDPATGHVLSTIDASGLLSAQEAAQADVLNGIAYDEASGHFFITGKLWPRLFEVRFDFEAGASTRDAAAPSAAPQDAPAKAGEPVRVDSEISPSPEPGSLSRAASHNCACRLGDGRTGKELGFWPLGPAGWFWLRRLRRRRSAVPCGARAASKRRAARRPRS